jgi:HSP20 family protein
MRSFQAMSLSHFDPLVNVRVFEDAFNRLFNEPATNRPWAPAVDVYETENELVLKADLPAVELNDIDVRVENQTLTISGERKFEQQNNSKGFHRIERSYGKFSRSFSVPTVFDSEQVAAEFQNGVLTVKLPKKEAAKPRQVKIESRG